MSALAEIGYMAAVGTFDGVHRGHAFVVERLKAKAAAKGLKTKIITFENHPLSVVAPERVPATLSRSTDRLRLLQELGVDEVVMLPFTKDLAALSAAQFLTYLRNTEQVNAIVMGFNNHIGSDRRRGADLLPATAGVDVTCLPELDGEVGVSSSAIRTALAQGNVAEAARLLGRNYEITGNVVGGKHLGREFGFPTANICPADECQLVPAVGVYAVDVLLPDGSVHRGMVNIGHRPTIDRPNAPKSIEVNIFDFNGDLYNQPLTIRFIKHLRPEQRFLNVDALIAQLHIDRQNALNA